MAASEDSAQLVGALCARTVQLVAALGPALARAAATESAREAYCSATERVVVAQTAQQLAALKRNVNNVVEHFGAERSALQAAVAEQRQREELAELRAEEAQRALEHAAREQRGVREKLQNEGTRARALEHDRAALAAETELLRAEALAALGSNTSTRLLLDALWLATAQPSAAHDVLRLSAVLLPLLANVLRRAAAPPPEAHSAAPGAVAAAKEHAVAAVGILQNLALTEDGRRAVLAAAANDQPQLVEVIVELQRAHAHDLSLAGGVLGLCNTLMFEDRAVSRLFVEKKFVSVAHEIVVADERASPTLKAHICEVLAQRIVPVLERGDSLPHLQLAAIRAKLATDVQLAVPYELLCATCTSEE